MSGFRLDKKGRVRVTIVKASVTADLGKLFRVLTGGVRREGTEKLRRIKEEYEQRGTWK